MRLLVLMITASLCLVGASLAAPEAAAIDCEQPRNGSIECDIAGHHCFGGCTVRMIDDTIDEVL